MNNIEGQNSVDNSVLAEIANKNILVLGGAGFIGSWLSEFLLQSDASVTCIDNFSSGREENLKTCLKHPKFELIRSDICEISSLNKTYDIIYHLASRASPFEFEDFPLEILDSNTIGTRRALELARLSNSRFVFASTSEIYGNPGVIPTPENYLGYVSSTGQRSCYDEGKRCGEAYVMAYKKQFGLDTRIARIFNTYGPRIRKDGVYGRVIPRFIDQALNNKPISIFGDGTQNRCFTYITDTIAELILLGFSENCSCNVLNIGSDSQISILELADLIKKITGSTSEFEYYPIPKDDPIQRKPDLSKMKELLKYKPLISLENGLKMMIKYQED